MRCHCLETGSVLILIETIEAWKRCIISTNPADFTFVQPVSYLNIAVQTNFGQEVVSHSFVLDTVGMMTDFEKTSEKILSYKIKVFKL